MRSPLARAFVACAVVASGALATAGVADAAFPSFKTVKLKGAGDRTEPRVTVDRADTRWVVTNEEGTGNAIVFFSKDAGSTWRRTASNPADQTDPTIDTDIVAMPTGRILASELDLAGINFPSSVTDDGGKTWKAASGSNKLADQDRQWFAVGPPDPATHKPRVYLLFHNLGSGLAQHNMWVATSTDGGETFGPAVPTALPGTDAYADLQCADSGGPSTIMVNQRTGRIYIVYTTRAGLIGGIDTGGCGSSVFGPIEANIVAATRVWVASSPDNAPGSWTPSLAVDDAVSGRIVSMQLAYGALDNKGNVYVAYPESPRPYPDYSGASVRYKFAPPNLSKWSAPRTLIAENSNHAGNVLVHIAVGDPGKLDAAYYHGVDRTGGKLPVWYMHVAQTLNATSPTPRIADRLLSSIPTYTGTAGQLMGACSDDSPIEGVENGFLCDRSTDVWGIALDHRCRLTVAWPTRDNATFAKDNGSQFAVAGNNPGTFVSTQTGGDDLCGNPAR